MTPLVPDKQALKAATRALVKASGGHEAAASFCRVGKSTLHRYGQGDCDEFCPVDVIADLEAVTVDLPGWPHVTRRLCVAAGGVFVRLPPAAGIGGDWHSGMQALAQESGGIIAAICAAIANDGGVDRAEALLIIKECDEAAAALMALKQLAERVAAGDAA